MTDQNQPSASQTINQNVQQAVTMQQELAAFVRLQESFEQAMQSVDPASLDPFTRDYLFPTIQKLFRPLGMLIQWSQIVEAKINEIEQDMFEPIEGAEVPFHVNGRLLDESGIVIFQQELDGIMSFFEQLSQTQEANQNKDLQGSIHGWMILFSARANGQTPQEYAALIKQKQQELIRQQQQQGK